MILTTTLIADVGGTSARWVLVGEDGRIDLRTNGFNPYVSPDEVLENTLTKELLDHAGSLDHIYYYGAGCARQEQQQRVYRILAKTFPLAEVLVEGDLIGAGRALLGCDKGLAVILGTGMNAGYFDNGELCATTPSLGYLLTDEGSGFDISRHFIIAWFKQELPPELTEAFAKHIEMTEDEFLRSIYSAPKPNSYIASFSKFIHRHLDEKVIRNMILKRFELMLVSILDGLDEPIDTAHFVGSVAWYFKDVLAEACRSQGVEMGNVLKEPIEGLVEYHSF